MKPTLSVLASLALSLPLLSAQSGGFTPGDLYLYSPAFPGTPTSGASVVRVQPTTGALTVLASLPAGMSGAGAIAYDPFRDRLIFYGGVVPNSNEVWLADAAGNLTSLGIQSASGPQVGRFSPRGDGIIYFVGHQDPLNISYFDAANQIQTLFDAGGVTPYAFPFGAGAIRLMAYHAGTNKLVAVTSNNLAICPGGTNDAVNVRFLELSADGSRVLAESCVQYDVNPGALGETPAGIGVGPGGDLILHIKNTSGTLLPRIARIDPAAETVNPFASTESAVASSGAYSQVLGRAIFHDSFSDELLAFAEGQAGAGTVIATGVGAAGSNEVATLAEVVPGGTSFGLSASPAALSESAGGTQAWGLDFGAAFAGELHLVVGSLTGWNPGTPFGAVQVPLVFDAYSAWTLAQQNSAVLPGSFGTLDAAGRANAAFVLPPALDPSLVGLTAYHAALTLGGGLVTAVTNPAPLTFTP